MSSLHLTGPRLRGLASAMAGVVALAASLVVPHCGGALAQEGWNPFIERDTLRPPPRRDPRTGAGPKGAAEPPADPGASRPFLPPMTGERPRAVQEPAGFRTDQPGPDNLAGVRPLEPVEGVERSELPPLSAGEPAVPVATPPAAAGSDAAPLERHLDGLEIPPRSPAVARLLQRLLADRDGPVAALPPAEAAARAGALYRAGWTAEAAGLVAAGGRGTTAPAVVAWSARLALAAGDAEAACRSAQAVAAAKAELPPAVRGEILGIQGYCAAAAGNAPAAGLLAQLAREEGATAEVSAALDAVAAGEAPRIDGLKRVGVLDWRLAELAGDTGRTQLAAVPPERAEPALLGWLASARRPDPRRLEAAEAAARLNVIDPAALAAVYRQQAFAAGDLAQPLSARADGPARRALLLRAAEAERTPLTRTRVVRAALDEARRAGLYLPIAAALARAVEDIQPVAEIGWFAETAIEVHLAAGQPDRARQWAQFAGQPGAVPERSGGVGHWLALIDIADSAVRGERGMSLASVEDLALRGRFTAEALHRLASVLDALDYNVPVRLWEAASRSPQPTSGFLPPTGVLAALQDAARRRDVAATIPLVVRTLGPDGPNGAHMIALGDGVRALKRAGLEREARAVAFEALFALWPRSSSA